MVSRRGITPFNSPAPFICKEVILYIEEDRVNSSLVISFQSLAARGIFTSLDPLLEKAVNNNSFLLLMVGWYTPLILLVS